MSISELISPSAALHGSQRPRISLVPEAVYSDSAEIALEVCRLAGLELDPWEEWTLAGSLGERADGKWSAFEVAEVVPRQNGKGTIQEARELAGLFAFGEERLIIHSAHEQKTSSEHQLRLLRLIESVPDFDRQVDRAPKGKGSEAIILRDGSRILFKTRGGSGGGGRGLTGDLVVLDEAMILSTVTMSDLGPTMAARSIHGNPQLWYAGSAVDQHNRGHDGLVLSAVRRRALERAPRLMYVEWSIAADDPSEVTEAMRDDPQLWAQANPGLGIRISPEHVATEAGGMLPPRVFAVERLGVGDWPDPDPGEVEPVIDLSHWPACEDPRSEPDGQVALAFDVTPDRGRGSIAAAGRRADGLAHVEIVDARDGVGWMVPRLAAIVARHRPVSVRCSKASPAMALVPALEAAGVKVEPVGSAEEAQAAGMFYDAVTGRALRHPGAPMMLGAMAVAGRRKLGEAWAWSRQVSTGDISPLVAVTLAHWAVAATPAPLDLSNFRIRQL